MTPDPPKPLSEDELEKLSTEYGFPNYSPPDYDFETLDIYRLLATVEQLQEENKRLRKEMVDIFNASHAMKKKEAERATGSGTAE